MTTDYNDQLSEYAPEPTKDPEAVPMTEDEIRAFIKDREAQADRPEVASEQAQAMDYYLRRPFGNEEEGRSQVISSDVWDEVEGLTPQVIDPFVSSSDVVQFNPQGPEDEEAAKQESDYVNFVVTQKNDAFIQFMAWVKAGLLQKNGTVKWFWDTTRRTTIQTLRGISDDLMTVIAQDKDLKILQATRNEPEPTGEMVQGPDGQPTPAPPEATWDVRVKKTERDGFARFEVVPPEELKVICRSPNIQQASFVQHSPLKSLSDLREMGYDVPDDIGDGSDDVTMNAAYAARNRDRDSMVDEAYAGTNDKSTREVRFRESYCWLDVDGDGIAELRRIRMVGDTILANEEVEEICFASWTPYQQLWQFDGRCPADETIEIQDVKSTLWRQSLDNIYTINNNRVFAGKKVNLDDLLDNQIAGVVRVDADVVGDQVHSAPVQPLGAIIQPMIEYADASKENRTGFSRYNQGSADLGNQKTLGEVQLVTGQSNRRTALVIRSLAEQGMKPLMIGIHGLLRRHATKAETVRLRGKWVPIDPRTWMARYDMTPSVGLGTQDKNQELGAQQQIIGMQNTEPAAQCVTPENRYNALAKYAELAGEKNPDKYFTHPDKMPEPNVPDPMKDPKTMLDVAGHKLDVAKFEKESAQKDRELDQVDRELDQVDQKQGIESQNAMQDALTRFHELQLKTEAHLREMQAPHPQAIAAGDQALAAHQQQHDQTMDHIGAGQDQQQLEQQESINAAAPPPPNDQPPSPPPASPAST